MADRLEEILGKRFNSLRELKEEITRLQDSIVNLNTDSEEFIETNQKLIAAQEQYTSVSRAKVEVINAEDDSIVGLQKQYKILYNEYKMMSEQERKDNTLKIEKMKALSDQINQLKMDAGSYKDNIGRYSDSIIDAFSKMGISMGALQAPMVAFTKIFEDGGKGIIGSINTITDNINKLGDGIKQSMSESSKATAEGISQIGSKIDGLQGIAANGVGAIKKLGTALKSFIAIPAVATIAAIVLAFKALQAIAQKVKEAINKNEESQMALKVAMSQFQPVIDAVSNAFDKLGTIVVKVIGFVADAFAKIRELGAGFLDLLPGIDGMQKKVKEQNKLYKETAKAENELVKTKREYLKLNADDTAEVERLREEASETTNLEERKKLLTEAKEKQAEIDARNIEVAKAELAIIQEQASRTANDAEMNDKLAAALAKVSQAEAEAAKNARQFNKQLNGGGGGGSALKNWREEAKKIYEETIENSKTEIQILTEKYEKEKKLLVKYHMDTTLLTKQYNNERSTILANQYKKTYDALKKNNDTEQDSWKRFQAATQTRSQQIQSELMRLERGVPTRIQRVEDALNDVWNKVATNNKQMVRAISDGVYDMMDNAGDFNSIMDLMYAKSKERAKNFPHEAEEYVAAANAMKELGEEGWLKLVEPITKAVDATERLDGIVIKTGMDIDTALIENKANIANLKKEANELLGEEQFKRIDDLSNKMSEGLFQSLYNMYKNNDFDKDLFAGIDQFVSQTEYAQLEVRKAAYEQELANFKGTQEQKLQMLQEYYDTCEQLRAKDETLAEQHAKLNDEIEKSAFDHFNAQVSAIGSITNAYASLVQAELNDSRITKQEAAKKINTLKNLERVSLAVNIAQIAASTASGIMDVWKAYGTETASNAIAGFGNPIAIAALNAKSLTAALIKTSALGTTGAANIAAATMGSISKIQSLNQQLADLDSADNGASAVANVQEIDSTPYTYTRTLQTQEEYDDLNNRQMWVSVSDIESGLNQRVKVVDESSF